jgi:predicted porin
MNKKHLSLGLVCLMFAGTAAHGDPKDPLPDSLSLGGVTLYGTIDVGYAYQTHGVPLNSQFSPGLEYQAFTTTRNFAGSVSTVAENGLELSKIGVRVQQPVSADWSLVARLESGVNPLSGQLLNNCASIAANSGLKQGQQTANADGSRCGQFFNSQAYGGVGNSAFGQLTVGRHDSLLLDATGIYDPQARAPAFSFLGYSGAVGGSGSTQTARWDNSAKYLLRKGAFHLAALYSNGGQDSGLSGKSYAGDIGIEVHGLSVDALYASEKGAVNLRSSFNNPANPLPTPGLSAYVSNNTSYSLLGKFTFDLAQQDKFALYAGYTHIEKAHADYTGGQAQGGYPIDIAININDSIVYNVYWFGARYVFSSGLNLVAGFYRITQDSYTIGKGPSGTQGTSCSVSGTLCAGDFNEASFVVDYVFNKHFDLYAGVNYSEVTDGLAFGFPGATVGTSGSQNQTTIMFGGRVRF